MLHLDGKADTPLYQQLYEQIRRDILSGSLPAGQRLKSLRGLAKDLQLSKNTVENAYSQLAAEGYISALSGSGFIVTPLRRHLRPPETASQSAAPSQAIDSESLETYAYDFHYGSIDASLFPYKIWRKLTADILANPPAGRAHLSASRAVKGDIELRKALAVYLYNNKGVCCTPAQIIICSGVRAAMDTLLAVLGGEKSAAVEDPGYPGARAVLQNKGFTLVPVPVLADGLDLNSLEASAARIIYTTPCRQFPTGMPLPEEQRARLLRWAEERGGLIIEDSYDSEFRYKGRTTPSLQSMDRHGRVVYMGTVSRSLSPTLRIGYMVLPEHLLPRFETMFADYPCQIPWIEQAVLARFIREGHWERHIRRTCQTLEKRHNALVDAINTLFGNRARIYGHNAGLHILLELPDFRDEAELVQKAAAHGVRVYPTSQFWLDAKHRQPAARLILGYVTLSESDIPEAVALLHRAWLVNR